MYVNESVILIVFAGSNLNWFVHMHERFFFVNNN